MNKNNEKATTISQETIVFTWNGDKEPERPEIAYYNRKRERGGHFVLIEPKGFAIRDHVRPVTPDDLKRWAGGE